MDKLSFTKSKYAITWEEGYTNRIYFKVGGFNSFILYFKSNSIILKYGQNAAHASYLVLLIYESMSCDSWPEKIFLKNFKKIELDVGHLSVDERYDIIFEVLKNNSKIEMEVGASDLSYLSSNVYYKVSAFLIDDYYLQDALKKNNN